jgi:hypothetical protein
MSTLTGSDGGGPTTDQQGAIPAVSDETLDEILPAVVSQTLTVAEFDPAISSFENGEDFNMLSNVEALMDVCFPEEVIWDTPAPPGLGVGHGEEGVYAMGTIDSQQGPSGGSVPRMAVAFGTDPVQSEDRGLSSFNESHLVAGSEVLDPTAPPVPLQATTAASSSSQLPGGSLGGQKTRMSKPTDPMTLNAVDFLLGEALEAANNSKLKLRNALKADLERYKRKISLAERSRRRSRREAAVSREHRATYVKRLEDLVLNLVRGNLQLIEQSKCARGKEAIATSLPLGFQGLNPGGGASGINPGSGSSEMPTEREYQEKDVGKGSDEDGCM